ncbi:MAG: ABC transporter ATP-binding protein [Clostridia bacterium]|nr:ABC transporter ATP-binding protein [Clostridia bacterium]MBR2296351.1 ABC transporter ATP-binding protein [Clostridia bacterium]
MKTIKKLASFVGEYKRNAILSPVLVSLEVIMECIIPFFTADLITFIESSMGNREGKIITAWLIDLLRGWGINSNLGIIGVYCGFLIVFALLSLMFGALAGIHCSKASCGFAKNLRTELFNASQDFSFENIDKFSSSSLVTRLTTDVTNVQQSFMMIIRTAIRSPLMFIFSIVMAFLRGGKMALIFVVIVPVLLFSLLFISRKAMPIFRKVFKKYDKLNGSIQENVKGMRVVKSFVREEHEGEKFRGASEDVRDDFVRAEKILAFNSPVMQLCIYAVMVSLCLIGSRLIISSNSTAFAIGDFSALLTYGMQILMSLMMLSMIFVMITMSSESASRICEVLDEKTTIKNPENPIYEVANGDIDFNSVNFKYAKRAEKFALEGIELHIKSGQTIGIIGGTGSSKSSLIQLIPRLYDVTEGSVMVGGIDVRSYDIRTLRDAVSVVLQKNVLFSGTIKENLRWGNENATDEELIRACELACADEFIRSFPDGYDTYIEQGGTNVSGGQKQRLCIARALLKKPKILILDDSTSAVDTRTDALIRKAMREEIPDTTKIIIAQRISSVQDADVIIILDDGKINGIGNHDELLETNEIYREIFTSQTKGAKVE